MRAARSRRKERDSVALRAVRRATARLRCPPWRGRTSERAREGGCLRAPAAPGPRRRAVGARRDAAVRGGRRRGHRGAQGRRLLSRRARRDLRGDARPLPAVGARRPGLGLRPPRPARLARAGRRPPGRVRAGRGRPRRHERPALRRHRARDGHAARAHPRRHRGRPARLRPPRRHARAARHGRAEGLRDRAERHDRGLHAHQAAARRGLPPAHAAVRERRRQRRHGPPDRLRRARSPDLRPAEVEPRDPGRPAVDGQDEPRAQHRRARRGDVAEARRAVLARDVQGRDRPAPAVLGRQGRPEPPEAGPARGRRLDARHRARWRRSAARRSSSTTRAR